MRIVGVLASLSLGLAGCAAPAGEAPTPTPTFAVLPGSGRWPRARTHELARQVTQTLADRGAAVVPAERVLATYPARLVKLDANWVAQLDVIDEVVKVTVLHRKRRARELRLDIVGWHAIPATDDLPALALRLADTIQVLARRRADSPPPRLLDGTQPQRRPGSKVPGRGR